jgi:SulP family sulfate permease
MLGATVAVFLLKLPVETIGTRFVVYPVGYLILRCLSGTRLVHGLLGRFYGCDVGAIESLMSAVVSDRMSNDRLINVELIGRNRNIFSPMFGGCLRRDHRPYRSQYPLGARSPVAA